MRYTYIFKRACVPHSGKYMNAAVWVSTCSLFALELLPVHRRQKGTRSRGRGWPRAYGPLMLSEETLILTEVGRARCPIENACFVQYIWPKLLFYMIDTFVLEPKKLFTTLIAFSQQAIVQAEV